MVKTTISIEDTTVARLKKQWQHGDDTYDKIINRLLDKNSPLSQKETEQSVGVEEPNAE